MDVVYSHVCGLDVHKKNVVACVLTPETKEIRTFSTMTEDLLSLLDWIKQHGCTHVAMESTGSFWKPVYNLLEMEGIQTLVVNAKHIKNVPGRKTDVKDAEWIAGLLRHGLLKGSFIPNREQRELRELIRYRRSLIEERAREANRMQKVLEGARKSQTYIFMRGCGSKEAWMFLSDELWLPSLWPGFCSKRTSPSIRWYKNRSVRRVNHE
jgi:transposase